MRRIIAHTRLLAGVAVALGGSAWALWILFGAGTPKTSSRIVPENAQPAPTNTRASSTPVVTRSGNNKLVVSAPPPSTPATQEQLETLRALVAAEFASALSVEQLPGLAASDTPHLQTEIAEAATQVLLPDYQRHIAFSRARSVQEPFFSTLPESTRESSFRTASLSFAGRQIKPGTSRMRLRYRDGVEVSVADQESEAATRRGDLDLLRDAAKERLTAVEYIFGTTARTIDGKTVPCRLGIWVGKSRSSPQWRTFRICKYDLPPGTLTTTPPF